MRNLPPFELSLFFVLDSDLSFLDFFDDPTSSHFAIEDGHGELALILVQNYNANQNAVNADEKKPIDLASEKVKQFLSRSGF